MAAEKLSGPTSGRNITSRAASRTALFREERGAELDTEKVRKIDPNFPQYVRRLIYAMRSATKTLSMAI